MASQSMGGTGLGLAICLRLVEMMGGRNLGSESAPEKGEASFTSLWDLAVLQAGGGKRFPSPVWRSPAKDAAAVWATGFPPASKHSTGRGFSVCAGGRQRRLIASLAQRLLQKRDFTVFHCQGWQAGDIVRTQKKEEFDLILMDIQIARDGRFSKLLLKFAKPRENSQARRTPIIAPHGACPWKEDRERCLSAGMDAYVHQAHPAPRKLFTVDSRIFFSPTAAADAPKRS